MTFNKFVRFVIFVIKGSSSSIILVHRFNKLLGQASNLDFSFLGSSNLLWVLELLLLRGFTLDCDASGIEIVAVSM